jgi:hypothetical protein
MRFIVQDKIWLPHLQKVPVSLINETLRPNIFTKPSLHCECVCGLQFQKFANEIHVVEQHTLLLDLQAPTHYTVAAIQLKIQTDITLHTQVQHNRGTLEHTHFQGVAREDPTQGLQSPGF